VNVWSVEYEQFEDFAAVEEFQDPEQFSELVEGRSFLHSRLFYYNIEDHVWFEDRWMVTSLCDE
jgi:hypothetical protein